MKRRILTLAIVCFVSLHLRSQTEAFYFVNYGGQLHVTSRYPTDFIQPVTLSSGFSQNAAGVFTNVSNTTNGQVLTGITQTQINNLLVRGFNSSFFFTDSWEIGMLVPATATVSQANTYNTFAINRSTTTNAVGYFSVAAAGATGAKIWSANYVASDFDDTGTNYAATVIGLENDLNCNNTGSTCVAYSATGGSNAASLASSTAYLIGILGPSIRWQQGILSRDRATTNFAAIGAQNATGTPSSYGQALLWTTYNSGGVAQNPFIRAYPAGGIEMGGTVPTLQDQGEQFAETTAPPAAAANDVCYGDSSTHILKCNYNNATNFHGLRITEVGTCTMVSGACTVTFAAAFNSTPIVAFGWNGTGTFTTGASLKCVPSTTTAVCTSSTATDTAVVMVTATANPS